LACLHHCTAGPHPRWRPHPLRSPGNMTGAIYEVNTTRVDDQATPDAGLLTRSLPPATGHQP